MRHSWRQSPTSGGTDSGGKSVSLSGGHKPLSCSSCVQSPKELEMKKSHKGGGGVHGICTAPCNVEKDSHGGHSLKMGGDLSRQTNKPKKFFKSLHGTGHNS